VPEILQILTDMTLPESSSFTTTTTMPVQWLQVPDAVRVFGISRSYLYELIAENRIKTSCLRKQKNIRGKRLISAESLNAFIERHANLPEGSPEDAK
jgi:hypothetical protein